MKKLFFAVLVVLFSSPLFSQNLVKATPEKVGMSSERFERLSNAFQGYVDNGQLPGSVVLVARKGKIAYWQSFGENDMENNKPMEDDAIFRIASQTKAIVSVGIMMLHEEGKLLITDPVGKYIPEFMETTVAEPTSNGKYKVVKAKRPITIRDLLTHSAGIGYGEGVAKEEWKKAGIQGWYFAHREEPVLETVKRMAALPNDAHPGEQFVYGYNTDILGALIEVVSGMPLDQYLKTKITDPLGMKDTHFYLPQEKASRLTTVYSSSNNGLVRAPNNGGMVDQGQYVEGPRMSFSGGAGFLSTALDYAKFLQMMLNKGSYNGKRILSPKTVELMTTAYLPNEMFPWNPGVGFGLGFSVVTNFAAKSNLGSNGEYGWGGAYHSTYWVDPQEELVVVYFTQVIPAIGVDDHDKLRSLVYQAIVK